MSERAINWVSHSQESTPIYPGRRSYRDPTADIAMAHIMAEERRKKRQNSRHQPARQKTGVWKEKGEKSCAKVK